MSIQDFIDAIVRQNLPTDVQSGVVRLYHDDSFTGASFEIDTRDYRADERHSIAGSSIQDRATYVAFNLPIGTVMTLMDNFVPAGQGGVADLRYCGRTVDLVGTGRVESVNLVQRDMNDCVSAFFYRKVDMNMGCIELYDHDDFRGNCVKIFLSEWPSGTVHSVSDWHIQDRISSMRWNTLEDRISVSLFDNDDGSGDNYNNIAGWNRTKEIRNLDTVGFSDRMSSFRWEGIAPRREVIAEFRLPVNLNSEDGQPLQQTIDGDNDSPTELTTQVQLTNNEAQTLTVAVTDTFVTGVTTTVTQSYAWGSDIGGKISGSLSVAMKFEHTNSTTRTTSTTKAIGLNVTQTVVIPKYSHYEATLMVRTGRLRPGTYQTDATRWYDRPVPGGVQDPENNNWYRRQERVTFTLQGGLASSLHVRTKATPLDKTALQPQKQPAVAIAAT